MAGWGWIVGGRDGPSSKTRTRYRVVEEADIIHRRVMRTVFFAVIVLAIKMSFYSTVGKVL